MRHPIHTEEDYERLYTQASEKIWVSGALRPDQQHVRGWIESRRASASVLDVGCYDGVLLAALGPQYRKYGVEASAAACDEARAKGIEIVAARIRDIPSIEVRFDVVCAVDVIEHVIDPGAFVAMLADRLAPGGSLIISTGSLDAPAWRFAGGRYWYCSFPEHISFISPDWAREVGAALKLKIVDVHRFAYCEIEGRSPTRMRRSYYRRVARAKARAWLQGWWPGRAAADDAGLIHGQPGLFEDHVILCFEKG
jgi:SAM-dependent methyltransferase